MISKHARPFFNRREVNMMTKKETKDNKLKEPPKKIKLDEKSVEAYAKKFQSKVLRRKEKREEK